MRGERRKRRRERAKKKRNDTALKKAYLKAQCTSTGDIGRG